MGEQVSPIPKVLPNVVNNAVLFFLDLVETTNVF